MSSREPSAFSFLVLGALQKRPMYEGTVPAAVVADRRRRNRAARRSRRINRRARR
ncbi:hypothetical protein [Mycobacteroides abscessus]|uniref:Uncharacterized protein n=1 Tax=Mycobacteroides abscessus subsp. massiliense TaxID=1962118 RepID=A0A1U2CGZ1_9MYCO|nr:hypothetical protein [Mycobacteroides abscessus]SKM28739.1 Uncharacterised protein [Mycobacteroides abscessus subsp. massiliense]SKT31999.1 Uncharacterised protein [Mycobacteroides abscessus subsp. massiliense]SKT69127.1 Uncharacterised protein [Mycobacteroides abscessus subsp. massiliense]SKX08771.1 Uncharacterised protein [Mycobacteroides abscessus subsp. massiliense]